MTEHTSVAEEVVTTPPAVAPKRGRGRPRIHPLPDPNAPKKPRGRPKKTKEEEKAEIEESRAACLEKRAARQHTLRAFRSGIQASDDAQAAFQLSCHLIEKKIADGENFITGGELIDLCHNLTGVNLREKIKPEEAILQGIHRVAKYDTEHEVKDGQDTFAYGAAPDGKSPLAKELNKPFANMKLFWPEELNEFYIANSPNTEQLEWAARQAVRKQAK